VILPCRSARRWLAALSLAAVLPGPAPARAAASPDTTPRHVDLARHDWATPEDERRDRVALDEAIQAMKGPEALGSPLGAASLLRSLRLYSRACGLASVHGDYFHVRAAMDTGDRESATREDTIAARLEDGRRGLTRALGAVDERTLDGWLAAEPGLAPYRDFLVAERRLAAHAGDGTQAASQFDAYQRLVQETDFGTVPGPGGPLDVRRQRSAVDASPDSAVREAGARLLAAGYARHRDDYARLLVRTVAAQDSLARARGYADRPAQAYDERQLSTAEVRALIAAVRARGGLMQRYERAVARARTALAGRSQPRVTREQLARAMRQALTPPGPELARETDRLLDPREALLELGPGPHRQAGGFSFALRDGLHGVYLDAFAGYPADVRRLAHECGHALHYRIFEGSGAPACYEPLMSEVVAQLDETLITERLAAAAPDAADRLAWRQIILRQLLEVFLGAKDAELEQVLYDEVAAGTARGADDFDRVTARVDSAYSADRRAFAPGRWMRAQLLWEDPLYYSNYLYSGLLVAALHERAVREPKAFAPRYAAFMRATSAAPLRASLKSTLGVALDDPALLAGVFAALEREVAAYEREVNAVARAGR
jgi:oligoendopeptidase F